VETGERVGTADKQILVFGKGNRSRPLSDEEEDWEIWMSEELGTVGTEDWERQGRSMASETLGLSAAKCSGVVEGVYDDFKTTLCA
jgi:hypothetical protein